MTKKNFIGGLSSLLGNQPEIPNKGGSVTQTKILTKSPQKGTKEGDTRATFIVKEELLEKLKAIAYWDRVLIKEIVNTALQEIVAKYEKNNGYIKPIPKK